MQEEALEDQIGELGRHYGGRLPAEAQPGTGGKGKGGKKSDEFKVLYYFDKVGRFSCYGYQSGMGDW